MSATRRAWRGHRPTGRLAARWIALGYAVAAATWIVGSGVATGEPLIGVSVGKGLGFVAITGVALHLALGRRDRAIAAARDREAAASERI